MGVIVLMVGEVYHLTLITSCLPFYSPAWDSVSYLFLPVSSNEFSNWISLKIFPLALVNRCKLEVLNILKYFLSSMKFLLSALLFLGLW